MPLFGGPPDIEKLLARRDVNGLIKALEYQRGKNFDGDHHAGFQAVRTREKAARALGLLGDPRALDPLIIAMGDARADVCASAAEALGQLGDLRAVSPLIAAMASDNEGIHNAAVAALGRLPWRPDGEAGAVYRIARDEWDTCAQIGVPAIEPLLAVFKGAKWSSGTPVYEPGKKRDAAGALVEIGAPAIEPVLAALASVDYVGQEILTDVLVGIGEPAVWLLIAALGNPDSGVRSNAVRVLGQTGDSRAVEPLVVMLREGGSGIGRDAARALGRLGDQRAVEPLIVTLEDRDQDDRLRQCAAEALGALGGPRAFEPLVDALVDDDNDVSAAAATTLGELGDPRAVKPLVDALARHNRAAVEALRRLAWEPSNDAIGAAYRIARGEYDRCIEIGAPAIEPLVGLLDNDHSKTTRQEAAAALVAIYRSGKIGPEQQAQILAQRTSITAEHNDELLGCWITEHSDYGIGVKFPI